MIKNVDTDKNVILFLDSYFIFRLNWIFHLASFFVRSKIKILYIIL